MGGDGSGMENMIVMSGMDIGLSQSSKSNHSGHREFACNMHDEGVWAAINQGARWILLLCVVVV